jgi:predicted dehydrogenase
VIQEGRLGDIQHVNITSMWTRTAAYYASNPWRATWENEGGGVLLNQSPHDLDLLCHLLGPPATVVAWTRTRLHAIETEDTVQAMLEWPNGALGSLHVSTAECGRPQRLDIIGTGGTLQIGDGEIAFEQAEVDLREFIAQCPDGFGEPARRAEAVELGPPGGKHGDVYRDLHEAIAEGRPPMADGVQGRMSLELANAMTYSSYVHEEVALPLDRAKYAAVLEALRAAAR